jgi:hypothetical protein
MERWNVGILGLAKHIILLFQYPSSFGGGVWHSNSNFLILEKD